MAEAAELVNRLAPEHLTLFEGATGLLGRVQSAGSIFLGAYSPVAAGDSPLGDKSHPAHRRGGTSARRSEHRGFCEGDLSPTPFPPRFSELEKSIVTLANTEGLKAHAYSVQTRLPGMGLRR